VSPLAFRETRSIINYPQNVLSSSCDISSGFIQLSGKLKRDLYKEKLYQFIDGTKRRG
jgi:hypothetical protein